MELLRAGLAPYVEREIHAASGNVRMETIRRFSDDPMLAGKTIAEWDIAGLLRLMTETWNEVFRQTLGFAERNLVGELREWRNRWAHQNTFSGADTERTLDSAARLLTAVSAPQADELSRMKAELSRLIYDEQVRGERRKAGGSLIEAAASGALTPWREIVTPHADVASGRYQKAEFAADLWQVHLGEGSDEYRKPEEFFRRTFLTESLKRLLVGGVQRLAAPGEPGGDPVVQLQTNFGGGKTHSMLALYHLFSGVDPARLSGVEAVLAEAGVQHLPPVKRVVLVGNKISPGNPVTKPDGTVVRTLWGELAYQLGGPEACRKAYARIAKDDENATSPGDVLRELFVEYGPCLILIDEWVAYARQLHDQSDLPGGSFETMFSFAQALTESAKLAGRCLLVVSLPASDTSGSPHTQADDVEVGGVRGREALDRLRNVVGRLESSWRPATAEEGFEIVRRRLFEPLSGPEAFKQRDAIAAAFGEQYRRHRAEFPAECLTGDYERRLQAAFPIHPEIFDQLYGGWSTLVKFQRTRGVLRLMAAVIHSLWEKGDRSPLILPSTIPIDDARVQSELTRYLSDNWAPIIETDVDGPTSTPCRIDGELPALGKLSATRRVARTIYLGSAPTAAAAHRGIEDRRVNLGCAMPGEAPAVFGDALRRLAATATYLYQDGSRYWYSTQPTVTRLAEDRAEQLAREPDKVATELERRLRDDVRKMGDFPRIHAVPRSSSDAPDDLDARLVVLPPEHAYTREPACDALKAAKSILENRGSSPRIYRNTLVFLAADKARLQDLDQAVRKYLAWDSIVAEKETLNLDPHQRRQAEQQHKTADGVVTARLPETYQWLLVPEQATPQSEITFQALRLTGAEALAVRASRKLRQDELLLSILGPVVLRKHMDDFRLWRGADHVLVRQLVEDFATYLYLPRLAGPGVLTQAIRDGISSLTWEQDTFAYAGGWDADAGRYLGLQAGGVASIARDGESVLVKSDAAVRQLDQERREAEARRRDERGAGTGDDPLDPRGGGGTGDGKKAVGGTRDTDPHPDPLPPPDTRPRRFQGSVRLDPTRLVRDAGTIAEEVVARLTGLVGADVEITLEIQARIPDGASENVVRAVTENCRTLRFDSHGFEES
jgi:predicted AAA+ superfamily ATPase